MILPKLRRLLDYLEHPQLFQARRTGVRVDFLEELIRLREEFALIPRTIVDVGANHGEYIRAAQFAFPEASIEAFEPTPALYERLRSKFEGPLCHVFPYALDRESGRQEFHLTGADDLSSLLKPTADLRSRVQSDEHAATCSIEVESRRMDEVLKFPVDSRPVLIKIDVQGSELRVLQGASRVLDQVACVKLEYDFDPLYEGQASVLELFSFMEECKFSRFLQVDVHINDGKIRRCDILFFKDESEPGSTPHLSQDHH